METLKLTNIGVEITPMASLTVIAVTSEDNKSASTLAKFEELIQLREWLNKRILELYHERKLANIGNSLEEENAIYGKEPRTRDEVNYD